MTQVFEISDGVAEINMIIARNFGIFLCLFQIKPKFVLCSTEKISCHASAYNMSILLEKYGKININLQLIRVKHYLVKTSICIKK